VAELRAAGDTEGQRKAKTELRVLRLAMGPPRQKLMEIPQAERQQRTADNAVRHEAGVAQNREMLANRRIARVTLNTNSGRALSRASKTVSIPGVPLEVMQALVRELDVKALDAAIER
jgi:hypothetical protein